MVVMGTQVWMYLMSQNHTLEDSWNGKFYVMYIYLSIYLSIYLPTYLPTYLYPPNGHFEIILN